MAAETTGTVSIEREQDLRQAVRDFLAAELPTDRRTALGMSGGWDADFSRKLAERGWVGMAIPREYGGGGAGAVERFIITEELLAAQAPVSAHWIAERQMAPSIARFGTDEQRRRFLPEIASGTCFFAIGMSEPESGSDLASVRTRGRRVDGGWRLSGTKIWTTGADRAHFSVVLIRTGEGETRHDGLSQVILDLRTEGVEIHPIDTLEGEADFCEVVLDDVFVPDGLVLGQIGEGWQQVTAELSHERYGPERWLSSWGAFTACLAALGPEATAADRERLGALAAELRVVRRLSLAVAHAIDAGASPQLEAAAVKDLGTRLEQRLAEAVRTTLGRELDPTSPRRAEMLAAATILSAPVFTIRGGTTEILRSIVARGGRAPSTMAAPETDPLIVGTVEGMFADLVDHDLVREAEREGRTPASLWEALHEGGFGLVGLPEEHGGGGTMVDAAALLQLVGRHTAPVPLAEQAMAGRLLVEVGMSIPEGTLGYAPGGAGDDLALSRRAGCWSLNGTVSRVPWGRQAAQLVAVVPVVGEDQLRVVVVAGAVAAATEGQNLAGEPRDELRFDEVDLDDGAVRPLPAGVDRRSLAARGAVARGLMMAGALKSVRDLCLEHCAAREQFGRPLDRFQAVAQNLAVIVEQTALASTAADLATREAATGERHGDAMVAKAVIGAAATEVARLAHQVHGAIGVTEEYRLQLLTRRLWSWRDEHGSEALWAERIGQATIEAGAESAWEFIVADPEA